MEVSSCSNKRLCTEEASGNNFDKLPDEMVEMILDFVQTSSEESNSGCKSARLVCRQWNCVISRKLEYNGELKDTTIESFVQLQPEIKLKRLVLSRLYCNRVRSTDDTAEDPTLYLKNTETVTWMRSNAKGGRDYDPRLFNRSVEHLVIGGEAAIFLRKHGEQKELPYSLSTGFAENHRMLYDAMSSVKGEDLVNIVSQLRDVKTLTLSSIAFISVSMANVQKINFSLQFSSLSTLDLCIGKKTDLCKLALLFENATFPALSSLYIRVYAMCIHFSLFINFYRFISRHLLLKNLSVSQAQAVFGLPNPDCSYPAVQLSAFPGIADDLMKIKLECLRMDCVVIGHNDSQQWKILERSFIKNQTSLRGLELQLNHRFHGIRLDEILPSCGQTLERLEFSSHNTSPNHFDCSTMSSFTQLKDFHLYLRNHFCTKDEEDMYAKISNIHLLPSSIESLHLGKIPSIPELQQLQQRLVNLKRVSYSCTEEAQLEEMTPLIFVNTLLEHLKFPNLTEYRMYQYACTTVKTFLQGQEGLVCYIEDEDSVVVLVDKEGFDLEAFSKVSFLSLSFDCTCKYCNNHASQIFHSVV